MNKYNAKVFKAPAIYDFMKSKRFFYGDSSVRVIKKFDEVIFEEVRSRGIVTERAKHYKNHMYTHPAMFEFFGVDREESIRHWLTQTQSGLMILDSQNETIRDKFFKEWISCSYTPSCISPHNIITGPCQKTYNYHRPDGKVDDYR